MKNIAIIPARSGSKGLTDKNIKEINGIPLLAYSIKAAEESGLFEEIMVSTDSEKYADIAIKYGAKVPFLRSQANSCDNAGSWEVVKEVLAEYRKGGRNFETVCLLQPTSPLREAQDIINGYEQMRVKKADAITSVCEVDHSPQWSTTLDDDLSLKEFRKNVSSNLMRQKLGQYYRINGALYIRKIEYTDTEVIIKDKEEYAIVMGREKSIDIDTLLDFKLAEFLLTL